MVPQGDDACVRTIVVGHVEWVEFVRVDHVPKPGEIVHAHEGWSQPGGGGANAAVQLAKLAGGCTFFTALGNDELGHKMHDELRELGVTVRAAWRDEETRRAITHVDAEGERTITVIGDRLEPSGNDAIGWDELDGADCAYLTAGDATAFRMAQAAGVLVATSRALHGLSGIRLDALVGSATDAGERYAAGDLDPAPTLVVRTEGDRGGTYEIDGRTTRYEATVPPGPIVDRYGAGDSFAAGLTFALGQKKSAAEAVGFAARCGAAVVAGRGPFESQLTR